MKTTGNRSRLVMLSALACAFFSVGSVHAYDSDATGEYVLDASGNKHYLLFQKGFESSTTAPIFCYDRTALSTATSGAWQDGSIWTFEKDTSYGHAMNLSKLTTFNMYGMLFETAAIHNNYIYLGNVTNNIGAFGIKSEAGGFRFMFHKASSQKVRINLAESQTWSGPDSATLAADAFVVAANYPAGAGYNNNIYAADDVVWTLSGNLLVNMLTYENVLTNADVVIKAPAVMAIAKHSSYGSGRLNARSLTLDGGAGVHFGTDKSIDVTAGPVSYNVYGDLGSIPEISPLQVAQTIILTNGATLLAKESTTVTGGVTIVSAANSVNAVSGPFSFADDETVIRVDEGSTLDLTAARFDSDAAHFSLSGSGTVTFDCAVNGPGGAFCIPAGSLSEFGGSLVVTDGVLVLDDVNSIPAGKVTTQGDGVLFLVDPTGFDADLHMGGTKACSTPPFFVTDEPLTGEISVGAGEALHVFGNGLGSNASLSLGAGARLVFCRTATVAAPITSSGDVYFETLNSSVTGTVAGVWTADKPAGSSVFHAYLTAPGLIILSGGGSIGSNDDQNSKLDVLHMRSGEVLVTGSFDAYCSLYLEGGHLTFRDGGEWAMKKSWVSLKLDKNTTGPACLEIGSGGVVSNVNANLTLVLGGTGYESKMLLSGGYYYHRQDGLTFNDNGVLEIDSGVFRTGRRARCDGTGTGSRVILRNGMYYLAGTSTYGPCLFDGSGTVNVHIAGMATLRTSGPTFIPDTTNEVPGCSWTCDAGARLQMVGSSIPTTNVLHNFSADGLVFNLNKSDYSPNSSSYVMIEPVNNPASVGFVLPGNKGCAKVAVTNDDVALNVSYVVPAGETFDVRNTYDSQYTGFTSATVSNLIFESDSTLAFPFFDVPHSPLSIIGTVALPEAMTGTVVVAGTKANVEPTAIIAADGGVSAPDAGCAWTVSGVNALRSTFGVAHEGLTFAYRTPSFIVILK